MSDPATNFLKTAGWQDAQHTPLAGDASARRYERLVKPDGSRAVLMLAGREGAASTRLFQRIGLYLTAHGLSAPAIYAEQCADGLLLLEDFGDTDFARSITAQPALEDRLYQAATETLLTLGQIPLPDGLTTLDTDTLVEMTEVAFDVYATHPMTPDIRATLHTAFTPIGEAAKTLALRDFHAQNLMWLPDRELPKSVGLLDFQDAVLAHPAYDLMSLLQDIRRDVSAPLKEAMLRKFAQETGRDLGQFRQEAALVSAQRNLRILGVFARLGLHHNKPQYIYMIPAAWRRLTDDLSHPELTNLRRTILGTLPPPTPAFLSEMTSRCTPRPNT